eukprot:gene19557-21488_t
MNWKGIAVQFLDNNSVKHLNTNDSRKTGYYTGARALMIVLGETSVEDFTQSLKLIGREDVLHYLKQKMKNGRCWKDMRSSTRSHQSGVLLSYHRDSEEQVDRIKEEIESPSYSVSMDKSPTAVEMAALFVVCMTQQYEESEECLQELYYACENEKKIALVVLQENYVAGGILGFIVKGKSSISLSDDKAFDSSIKEIKEDIHKEVVGMTAYDETISVRDLQSQEGHVMLSYHWGSQAQVHRIKRELEKAGYKTWMDVAKMDGGLNKRMAEAVEGATVVVVFMTQKYEKSHSCMKELDHAYDKRKRIVPVKLEKNYNPSGALGLIAAGRIYEDFSDKSQFYLNFARLKRVIDAALGITDESKNKTLEGESTNCPLSYFQLRHSSYETIVQSWRFI